MLRMKMAAPRSIEASPTGPAGGEKSARAGSVALDQWRGLALVLVLVAHAFHNTTRVDGLGRVGVNLFFFISGILVHRSLSRGMETQGRRWAVSFWHRRVRRLYPALLAYIGIMLATEPWLQRIPFQVDVADFATWLRYLPAALFYFINYLPGPPRSLGHLWSLACEMQFYLLAPVIFYLAGRTVPQRQAVFGTLLMVLLVLGAGEPFLLADPYSTPKYHFEFAVWPMMLGFWCEFQRAQILRLARPWLKAAFGIFLTLGAGALPLMLFGPHAKAPTVAAGALTLVPCLLAYLCGWPIASRVGSPFRWLGERTYSIYLWQQPLTICGFLPVVWWPAGALASILCGGFWFHWFERPFLSDNRKRQLPKTANS